MSYKALYRKYRPQSFNEVCDQEHITRTLKNALSQGRISHAYLFSGPRGTGKTSVAKIFAKAINCTNNIDGEPCNQCDICKGIQDGSISDVIEIDAASNNGVGEIRDLRDKVKYLPSVSKYKVYIIDEVHMLSIAAFNALLKTLEEPPKHIIFILCTTEPQKVPITIQSRCQRFDFHLITSEEIVKRLETICNEENLGYDKDALELVAEVSEGGMRDAISLLDQASAYSKDQHITLDDVLQVSGKLSNDTLIKISYSLYENKSLDAITLLESLLRIGKEIPKIIYGLLVFYKDILVIKNVNKALNKVGYESPEFKELVSRLNNKQIYKYIDILTDTQNAMRFSNNQRLYLELCFIKMADSGEIPQTEQVRIVEKVVERVVEKPVIQKVEEKPIIVSEKKEDIIVKTPIIEEITKQKSEVTSSYQEAPLPKAEDKLIEQKPETKEPVVKVNMEPSSDKQLYDLLFIESVLNHANKPFKESVIAKLQDCIEQSRNTEYSKAMIMLNEAKVAAASNTSLILVFELPSFVNLVMKKSNRQLISNGLSTYFGKNIDFVAIPLDLWNKLSKEFIDIYRANVKEGNESYIKLTYVDCPGLKEQEEEKEDKKENKYQNISDAFGDFIKIE